MYFTIFVSLFILIINISFILLDCALYLNRLYMLKYYPLTFKISTTYYATKSIFHIQIRTNSFKFYTNKY